MYVKLTGGVVVRKINKAARGGSDPFAARNSYVGDQVVAQPAQY